MKLRVYIAPQVHSAPVLQHLGAGLMAAGAQSARPKRVLLAVVAMEHYRYFRCVYEDDPCVFMNMPAS